MQLMYAIRYVTLFVFVLSHISVHAQSTIGITGKRDTSFTISNEYNKLKKNYPEIKIAEGVSSPSVKEKRNLTYCTIGQRKLALDVFYPATKTKQKSAAIILIHGGGWRSGDKAQHHPLAQQLAKLGYVCFTPEYRLSTEALYPAAIHDVKAAVRWVRAHAKDYNIDTAKIAIAGFSAGGQLAALLGTTIDNSKFENKNCNTNASSKVNAIIDIDGILSFVHPESGEGDDSEKTSAATYWFGYSKKDNPELWKEASALTHVSSNTPPALFINSSVSRMHAGRDDFMKVLRENGIYTEVKTFEDAPHSFPLFHPWFEPTIQIIGAFLKKVFTNKNAATSIITVAQDGTGQYSSMQAAFNAVPVNNNKPVTIFIKKGTYQEKLSLDSTKRFVTLVGEDKFNTILTWNDHTGKLSPNGDTINTYTSQSFLEAADDFTAKNITFQNNAGFSAGQAVAIQILGDRTKFINCRFLGNQDVLFPAKPGTRQYFEDCYIEGTTDFIFGPSTAWFEKCHIHSKKNSHITAASTPKETAFGYVFNECIFTADTAFNKVTLGRPWRPYSSVTYINCWLGKHIIPEGWDNWKKPANEATARYAEYKSTGPGANPSSRVKWAKQLTDGEVKKYTLKNILGDWLPEK